MPRPEPLPWPFEAVVDSRQRRSGWVTLHSHVRSPDRMELFAGLRRSGTRFLGMTSDGTFPAAPEPGSWEPLDYGAICEAWAHCFRDPGLLPGVPRDLLCRSDFTDAGLVGDTSLTGSSLGAFDFVYVGAPGGWKADAKGWALAQRCLPVLTGELGLRGLLVDVDPALRPSDRRLTVVPALRWPDLMATLAQARLLFAPNGLDASPRILAEALSLDVPLLVNRAILGGWHYVNGWTGGFFDDAGDVGDAAARIVAGDGVAGSPRDWFRTHHGPYLAGRRLLGLLSSVDPQLSEDSHLMLEGCAGRGDPGR